MSVRPSCPNAQTTNWSDGSITAIVLAGATSGSVTVTRAGATSNGVPFVVGDEGEEYVHTDAIGSVRMVTGYGGYVLSRHDYVPFGDEWPPGGTAASIGFAGTERDAETETGSWTALHYLGARQLHGPSGRFTGVDPDHVNGMVGDPQSWNGYAYARNNPLRFVDPDGRQSCQTTYCVDVKGNRPSDAQLDAEGAAAESSLAAGRRWLEGAFSDILDVITFTTVVGAPEDAATWTPQEPTLNPYLVAGAGILVSHRLPPGGIVAKNGVRITGFVKHRIDRAVGDTYKRAGTRPQAILDALKNPKKIVSGVDELGRPFQVFTGKDARVVVNPQTGQVISVNPMSGAGAH